MTLKKLLSDSNGFNQLVKAKHGYCLYNKHDTYIGQCIEKYGEISEGEADIFKQLCREGDVVIDVGANIGVNTLPMSKIVGNTGRVYAFEPQHIVFQTLCANMALNSITNVRCQFMGLSDKAGHALIPDINYDKSGNFGGFPMEQFNEGHKTPVVTLDEFLEVDRLKLIKIDVEGMESAVIRGATKTIQRFKPFIYVENDRIEKSKELIELLWSLDYQLYWHTPKLFNPKNFAGDLENKHPNIVSMNMLCIHNSTPTNMNGFRKVTDSNAHPSIKN